MQNNKVSINFGNHIQENFWLYVISLLCIFTGVVLGIYSVKYMANYDKTDLMNYLNNFSQNIAQGNFKYENILIDSIKNNIPLILATWFLGLTMVGIPIILLIDLIKGFTIGFTISFVINNFGTKGIGIVLVGVIPQNLIYIPCVLFSSVISMVFSINLLKNKMSKSRNSSIWMDLLSYSLVFLSIIIIMVFGFLIEAYLSPTLVKLII